MKTLLLLGLLLGGSGRVDAGSEPQCGDGLWDAAAKQCLCATQATRDSQGRCVLHACGAGDWDPKANRCACAPGAALDAMGQCEHIPVKADGSNAAGPRGPGWCGDQAEATPDGGCRCWEDFVLDSRGYCLATPSSSTAWAGCTQSDKSPVQCWPGTVWNKCNCECVSGRWDEARRACVAADAGR